MYISSSKLKVYKTLETKFPTTSSCNRACATVASPAMANKSLRAFMIMANELFLGILAGFPQKPGEAIYICVISVAL